jgi:hypothetical protein
MPAYAGTRQDVHYKYKSNWEPEVCIRENNRLLSELGRKHLLGSGVGKGYKVRDVKTTQRQRSRIGSLASVAIIGPLYFPRTRFLKSLGGHP